MLLDGLEDTNTTNVVSTSEHNSSSISKFKDSLNRSVSQINLERKELINYRVYGSEKVVAIIKLKKRETLRRVLHLP